MRLGLTGFVLMLILVFGRAIQREITEGAAFRAEALKPVRRETALPGGRGRILGRDGTVLACDRDLLVVAVQYRYLEAPPDPRWLRQTARKRLTAAERRTAARIAEEENRVVAERLEMHDRLAALCGVSPEAWQARAHAIQTRVQRIAAGVRRRHAESMASSTAAEPTDSFLVRLGRLFRSALEAPEDDTAPIHVAEELEDHVMAEDVSPVVVAEIDGHPKLYPGVRVLHRSRRSYPSGVLAAHVLGYLGPSHPGESRGLSQFSLSSRLRDAENGTVPLPNTCSIVGLMGVERQFETMLCGHAGLAVDLADHAGHVLKSFREEEPHTGSDLRLTLDPALQRAAETLLDSAIERRAMQADEPKPGGGAILVMDVHNGELLAMASAPRFDPGLFGGGDSARREALLTDPGDPLFDRATAMALPPGSVFKTLTAAALLETGTVDPQEPFVCQGYLKHPDRQRCEIYVHHGVGHGEVTLADALAQSCNVYFFHYAGKMGPEGLVDWAQRFGFGHPTGIDLPGEAAGRVPTPETIRKLEGHAWHVSDTQTMAIGQGSLTATPLQVLRMMAAIANGGFLVAPHVAKAPPSPEPRAIAGLHATTLAAIREGLERVVADPKGTAHGSVYLPSIAIAGKTGTASVGEGIAEHAWFAGYFPADKPQYALVVVVERAGDSATAAGPVVKRLVLKMLDASGSPSP